MRGVFGIALALALGAGPSAAQAASRDPVLVELYTSQGCEECWRANAVVADLADEPGVLALTFPVDYWDYLGWEDSFARPEFTDRQERYKTSLRLRMLRTPQVVVGGASHASGFDKAAILSLVAASRWALRAGPEISSTAKGARVLIRPSKAPVGGAEVWMVRYDPRPRSVTVKSGENRGRAVPHRNVVRELVRLGVWTGRGRTFALPNPTHPGLRTAVIVQGRRDGRLISSRVL